MATDLEEYLNYLNGINMAISTCLRKFSSIRSFYLFLKKEGYSDIELEDIDMPKKPMTFPNCLSIEEVDELLDMPDIEKPEGLRDKAMLELMYASGLRVSELLSLERRKINLEKGIVKIFGKGAKERKVPVGEFAMEYIKMYIDGPRKKNPGKDSKYLFLNK